MKSRNLLIFSLMILLAMFFVRFVGATTISSCPTTISTPGDYDLSSDISSATSCITITTNDVNLDCKGNTVVYGSSGGNNALGIDATLSTMSLNNITIKNCNVMKNAAAGSGNIGIRIQRTTNSVILNNSVSTNGTSGNNGIYLLTSATGNTVENNTVLAYGSTTGNMGIYLSSDSNYNTVRGNVVTSVGTTTSYALYDYFDSNYNLIDNNSFSSYTTSASGNTDMHAVYIYTSKNNNITNNYIYSKGITRNYAMYLTVHSRQNNIINNTIVNNGTSTNYGIYSIDAALNNYEGNSISVYGTTTLYGIYLVRSNFNNLDNNSFSASGTTPVYAAYLANSYNNNLDNNNYYSNGTTANYALQLNNGDENTLTNSFFNITGTTTTNYGVYLIYSNRNLIENNTIYSSGTSTNPGIGILSAKLNKVNNNVIRTLGTTTLNYGVYLNIAELNNVTNNDIRTSGTTTNYGVYAFTNSHLNIIKNNTIIPGGTTTLYGVYLNTLCSENIISDNYIVSNGSTQSGTTNNWGVYLVTNSNDNTIENNSILTGGGTPNYGVYILTDSDRNTVRNNLINTSGSGATNVGVFISASNNNLAENNLISTSGSATDYGVYVYSSALWNTINNNTIRTSGSTNSHGIHMAATGSNYPFYTNISKNVFSSISGNELNVGTASIDYISLIDQGFDNYLFTGVGSLISVVNSSYGQIRFLDRLTGSGSGLKDKIKVQENYFYVDSSVSALNKSAEITEYNVSTTRTGLDIYRDGAPCPAQICENLTSLQAGTVIFNVTGWSDYSINASDQIMHNVSLNYPLNNSNITTQDYNFNFTVVDETSSLFKCYLYIDDSLISSNETVSNSTLTNLQATGINGGSHLWYISCLDEGNWSSSSEVRVISNSLPYLSYNSPDNDTYFDNVNEVRLNFSLSDTENTNFSLWIYGDNNLINYSYNVSSGDFVYNWSGISLGPHNWSVTLNDGFSNSTGQLNTFNLVNLTINCEAGGPYQSGALVLIQGNVSDGLNYLSSSQVNISIYRSGLINSSKILSSLSDGSFQTTFSNLADGNYTLNASFSYHGNNKTCEDYFNLTSGGSSVSSSASFVLDKLVSVLGLNSSTITYNVSLLSTNIGGSDASNVFLNDSDSSSSPYYLGTLSSGVRNETSYAKSYVRNSSSYNVSLSVAKINGTDSYSGNEISYNSSTIILFVPAITANTNLTITKNAQFVSENETSVTYNLTSIFVNSGGYDISSANISDADIGLNSLIDLNLSQIYSVSGEKTITKSSGVQTYNFLRSNATHDSILYESNQITVLVPSLSSSSNLSIYKSSSVYSSTNTNVTYNVSLSLSNLGGRNITGAFLFDSNSTSSPYNIGTIIPSQTVLRSYLITFDKSSSDRYYNLSIATANGTDSISGQVIDVSSDQITVLVPAIQSSASFVLDKLASVYNLTNNTFVYNITLRLTNKGGSNSTNSNITDNDYNNSLFSVGTISTGESIVRSYLANFSRNSTTYYTLTNSSVAYGIDAFSNSLISANSTILNLTIPSYDMGQQVTLIKNAYYNSENSTSVNYTLSIEVINSGGVDLNLISLIDTDLDLTTSINLNRSQNYSYSGSLIIQKAASNTEKTFVKSSATINSQTYQSNQIKINVPGYGGPADTVVYAPESVYNSTSFDSIIQITNQNPDIGQNFVVDYWITNNVESANYSSGQQTIYVGSLDTTNITVTLTSPSTSGVYKLRAIVSYIGGPDIAFDSFEVISENSSGSGSSGGGSSSGGSGSSGGSEGGKKRITGDSVEGIVCNPPYMRFGSDCCLDENNNSICDRDEAIESKSSGNESIASDEGAFNIKSNNFFTRIIKIIERAYDNLFYHLNKSTKIIIEIFAGLFLILISSIITYKIIIKRNKEFNKVKSIIGTIVYSSNGNKIGKIKDVYIDSKKPRIYGLLVTLDKKICKKFGSKKVIIKYKHVESIKNVAVIDNSSSNYLERIEQSAEF